MDLNWERRQSQNHHGKFHDPAFCSSMLFLVTDQRMLLMIYRQLDVQSKHDDSGGTNTVLSFFLENSADGASWEYYKANGANKVPIQIL